MSFFTAKLLTHLTQPALLAMFAIIAGVVVLGRGRSMRLGRWLAFSGIAFFLVVGFTPISNAMLVLLEDRFPKAVVTSDADIAGIIVLGGFEDGWVSAGRGGLEVNEAADRLTETLRLALKHPSVPVVFTGGNGKIWGGGAEATGPVQQFLIDTGVAKERIVLEGKSRNTHENALFLAEMLKPNDAQRWVLVTSAFHMPRSVGLFRRAGFRFIPFPVDYKTRGADDMTRPFERMTQGLSRFDTAFNEWAGLFAYWMAGRIDVLFPGPE